MVDHGSMEFFGCTAALPHLEIQHTVRSMRNRLQRRGLQHARFFQLADGLPVCRGRTALHQIKRLFLNAPHNVVLHARIRRCYRLRLFVPGRIIVPGHKVNHICKLVVIQSLKIVHHIDGGRLLCPRIPQRFDFPFYKICGLICHKPFPVQVQSVQRRISFRGRTFHLIEVLVRMTPECRIPGAVQLIQRAVFLLHPAAERLLAQRAVALSAIFIRNMPCNHARVVFEHFRQFRIDDSCFFPVNR